MDLPTVCPIPVNHLESARAPAVLERRGNQATGEGIERCSGDIRRIVLQLKRPNEVRVRPEGVADLSGVLEILVAGKMIPKSNQPTAFAIKGYPRFRALKA
jgi:hypothetical protein